MNCWRWRGISVCQWVERVELAHVPSLQDDEYGGLKESKSVEMLLLLFTGTEGKREGVGGLPLALVVVRKEKWNELL